MEETEQMPATGDGSVIDARERERRFGLLKRVEELNVFDRDIAAHVPTRAHDSAEDARAGGGRERGGGGGGESTPAAAAGAQRGVNEVDLKDIQVHDTAGRGSAVEPVSAVPVAGGGGAGRSEAERHERHERQAPDDAVQKGCGGGCLLS